MKKGKLTPEQIGRIKYLRAKKNSLENILASIRLEVPTISMSSIRYHCYSEKQIADRKKYYQIKSKKYYDERKKSKKSSR